MICTHDFLSSDMNFTSYVYENYRHMYIICVHDFHVSMLSQCVAPSGKLRARDNVAVPEVSQHQHSENDNNT